MFHSGPKIMAVLKYFKHIKPSKEERIHVLGKTRRGARVGARDQWVKPGDGNWEIDGFFSEIPSTFSRELARDLHT